MKSLVLALTREKYKTYLVKQVTFSHLSATPVMCVCMSVSVCGGVVSSCNLNMLIRENVVSLLTQW